MGSGNRKGQEGEIVHTGGVNDFIVAGSERNRIMATDNDERTPAPRNPPAPHNAPRGVGALARGGLTATRIPPSLQAKMAAVCPFPFSFPIVSSSSQMLFTDDESRSKCPLSF